MPLTLIGSIAASRVCISFAALLVKVTARICAGEACPVEISQAMRVVSTRVLPDPAPARISACAGGKVTAASCGSLSLSSKGDMAQTGRRYSAPDYIGSNTAPRPWRRRDVACAFVVAMQQLF